MVGAVTHPAAISEPCVRPFDRAASKLTLVCPTTLS
jgi:hypothetical protein